MASGHLIRCWWKVKHAEGQKPSRLDGADVYTGLITFDVVCDGQLHTVTCLGGVRACVCVRERVRERERERERENRKMR